jgi:hypothetical protein
VTKKQFYPEFGSPKYGGGLYFPGYNRMVGEEMSQCRQVEIYNCSVQHSMRMFSNSGAACFRGWKRWGLGQWGNTLSTFKKKVDQLRTFQRHMESTKDEWVTRVELHCYTDDEWVPPLDGEVERQIQAVLHTGTLLSADEVLAHWKVIIDMVETEFYYLQGLTVSRYESDDLKDYVRYLAGAACFLTTAAPDTRGVCADLVVRV